MGDFLTEEACLYLIELLNEGYCPYDPCDLCLRASGKRFLVLQDSARQVLGLYLLAREWSCPLCEAANVEGPFNECQFFFIRRGNERLCFADFST